jgi:2'-5' RNA ligase
MIYGIAIFPNREVQRFANSYRKRYDPHYKLIPPHITLKEAFNIEDENKLQQVVAKIEEAAASISPFTLTFSKFSSFYPSNNTIYIAVDDNDDIHLLFKKLHEDILKTERPYGFVPHLTIAQKLSADELHDIYSVLKMTPVNLQTKVDRIHLLYQLDDGIWTVYQTFLLGRK